jgi:hypothetical protein
MGVSLVYLGKNDDDNEMHKMCKAIAKKLIHAGIQVQEANSESKDLPNDNSVTYDNVWFCGHSRFVEANSSIRKNDARTLGGFPIADIAKFIKACLIRGKDNFRLICCESAQQQRYRPTKSGAPPDGLAGVLGNELLQTVTNLKLLNYFTTNVHARVSHLEGLISAMALLWQEDKKTNQPAFDICGLWGAGDITDDNVPITSFLQDNGSLEAQAKMNDSKVKPLQQKLFETTFNNAHCSNNRLPDFFGYKISRNFLVDWAHLPTEKKTLQAVQ